MPSGSRAVAAAIKPTDARAPATATRSGRGRTTATMLNLLCALAAAVGTAALDGGTAAQGRAAGTCDRGNVVVRLATPQQVREACEAISDVLTYFNGIGFEIDLQVTIAFRGDIEAEGGNKHAHGFYDAAAREIRLYAREQARPWGEAWQDVGGSFLHHEVTHAAVVQILGLRGSTLPHEWHEFVAYAMQLELMDPAIRDRILERYSEVTPVPALTQINSFTYGLADPDTFAVLAFKSYRRFGGRDLVRRLLTAEFVPTPVDRMMPFPPN